MRPLTFALVARLSANRNISMKLEWIQLFCEFRKSFSFGEICDMPIGYKQLLPKTFVAASEQDESDTSLVSFERNYNAFCKQEWFVLSEMSVATLLWPT